MFYNVQFNNAKAVVDRLEAKGNEYDEDILFLSQNSASGDVQLSDVNIANNAAFITNLWD